jgi:pyocin large subunit-like protein
MRRALIVMALLAGLTACDAGPKVAGREAGRRPATAAAPAAASTAAYDALPDRPRSREEPVRLVAGKPSWSSNRKMSADENARSHFQRDGADFDSKTVDDFVAKAHAFTAHPPKSAERVERRNGDVLIYDEKSNTFAVMTRDGAPRTMFKPRGGRSYWDEQVRKEKAKFSGE